MGKTDIIIIGAGASGLMCAIEAGKRGRRVLVLDHQKKVGQKVLMSGGGRCNFTNLQVDASNYVSKNPHFCKSTLSRFTQWDFIERMTDHNITFHERDHGQLFCDNSAADILEMLVTQCRDAGVEFLLETTIKSVEREKDRAFLVATNRGDFKTSSLVVATGGLSIPGVGASPLGYRIAESFNINVWPPSPALVPFTLQPREKKCLSGLSGMSVDAVVSCGQTSFRENLLFTHRGLSGPVILQISVYWEPGQSILVNLLPGVDLLSRLKQAQTERPRQKMKSMLAALLPKRLVQAMVPDDLAEAALGSVSHLRFEEIVAGLTQWEVKPGGTEGYRTAEVTRGGVDCDAISSKTMESNSETGLFFVGEVLDVTGWLGGYNLQWAWSSGWVAGQHA